MKRFVRLYSSLTLLFVAFVAMLSLSGCHDWPEDDVLSSSPLWGRWTLERVDDMPVNEAVRMRYDFRQDPDNRTFNSGIGTCERYDATTGQWVSEPIEWTVESSSELTISIAGAPTPYFYLLEVGSSRTTLKLYNESTRIEQIFVKGIE